MSIQDLNQFPWFSYTESNTYVFFLSQPPNLTIIVIYINDYIVAATNISLITWIKARVQEHVRVSNLREVY